MNKHDTVIGYIEYLDCNGCVRERIPYVDAEKFKTRIYASLYCGEPIIPVLFPENLSQPWWSLSSRGCRTRRPAWQTHR